MQEDPDMRVGVAWFREAEWDRLRASAADPEVLEESYAEWLKVVERSVRTLKEAGVIAEKVEVRVAELEEWCRKEGRLMDSAARSEFAALLLHRKYHPPTGAK
jgi:hypothetical protein